MRDEDSAILRSVAWMEGLLRELWSPEELLIPSWVIAAGRLPTLFPILVPPNRWSLASREAGGGAEQWRLVRSGNDPPAFRVPRKGERPRF